MENRRQGILNKICQTGFGAPDELAKLFNVSSITARRDMIALEKEGLLRRVHGGAVPGDASHAVKQMETRMRSAVKEKLAIAKVAAGLLGDSERIFLDCGTTCLQLANILSASLGLTVFTYSLANIAVLEGNKGIRLIAFGGELDRKISAFVGAATESAVGSCYFDMAFFGATGIDPESGVTDNSVVEGGIKRIAAANAKKRVVLADGSKFGKIAFRSFLDIGVTPLTIITDSSAPEEVCDALIERKVEILKSPYA